ncbi:MAG: CDP-diacylglycerol--glycerol-3-phosphate 3-phosphatidyltransferase [Pseudomonadota bacterium]|nr:CDP-diacylglycerol--glycerol-3-phosphate 3-phosphatidyltransferase [Pseudomonadota bacterium]MEC8463873.1 CDP-diacylglycerol--glycerol-3-phosphate 3-phosphatidyltransferase [Pseudomonadota bacterium]MEC8530700.1 CDP-diacylglycerol--glycerol-3-phosphate 3-phosphatidyltransferase [Pseudomonadota bacterium]MEC8725430.1 CDP-diacylglycerol--glycerol-3-phosphate 3-phosphatidyltransferase [Pseudomonadota bacterium]
MILTLPNILTLSRVAVIPVLVALFFLETANGQWIACGIFIFSAITDFFDGFLARSLGQTTAFGTFLDPVADKLLVASALLMMVAFGQIAGVVVIPAIIILCREILVSGLREYLSSFAVSLPVSNLAKWKTTLQMAAICILIVGDAAHPLIPDLIPVRLIGEVGLWVAAIVTIITGSEYLRIGLRHMDQKNTS